MTVKKTESRLRSRRGVAIEMAIIAMLITVALSMLLVTFAVHESKIAKSAREDLTTEAELYTVGEYFFANPGDAVYGDYKADRYDDEDGTKRIEISKDSSDAPLLVIEISAENKIIAWDRQ